MLTVSIASHEGSASSFTVLRLRRSMKRHLACAIVVLSLFATPKASNAQGQSTSHSPAAQSARSANEIWADLIEGNERFVAGKPKVRDVRKLRGSLAGSQHPNVVVLGCADSRVAPEILFDQNLGDLFVVRSAGNIADAIGIGSIEYSVEHLGSSVLVVLGHTKCGAVTAACSREKMPSLNLQAIVDKIEPAVPKGERASATAEIIETAIKQNVHQSAKNVIAGSDILRHFVEQGKLTIIEAEYQLDTGKIVRLDGN